MNLKYLISDPLKKNTHRENISLSFKPIKYSLRSITNNNHVKNTNNKVGNTMTNHLAYHTRAPHAVPTLACQGPSFYLKSLVKMGHNSINIAFRVMSLALQLHLVMMS